MFPSCVITMEMRSGDVTSYTKFNNCKFSMDFQSERKLPCRRLMGTRSLGSPENGTRMIVLQKVLFPFSYFTNRGVSAALE